MGCAGTSSASTSRVTRRRERLIWRASTCAAIANTHG
jgi:hypothetical protein